ncbi:MAG: hypothetical protein F6K21_36915, partial [Symploca sp. SIO2D2]|nr:hypothetical protein [Symploca sp. SIO2D2]
MLPLFAATLLHGQTLIFNSGFEPGTTGTGGTALNDITGTDNSVSGPNDWVGDLEGYPKISGFNIEYVAGNSTQRHAQIINDPTGSGRGKILRFWLKEVVSGSSKSRIQTRMYNLQNMTEVTSKVDMYIHPDINLLSTFSPAIKNFTFQELWTRPGWTGHPHPFRLSSAIWRDANDGTDFYWRMKVQNKPNKWQDVDSRDNRNVPVPIGQWFTVESYFKLGNNSTGRVSKRIKVGNGPWQTIFDYTTATYDLAEGSQPSTFFGWNPIKQYMADEAITDHIRNAG